MMRLRTTALLAAFALVFGVARATAQSQTGEIFGKVTDESGAVLPGVTVTLSGPSLLQPQTAITSETGTYQFPRLTVGTYNLKFEITGFKTVVQEGIEVTVGFSANISPQLGVSSVQEVVTVTSETPTVDTRQTGTRQTFTLDQLQSIPSARDPWVILQQTAGIAMDRENIGGNMSGQQSNYVSRGGNPTNNKWSLDGVDITDMSATGASPAYYDFDSFQEMTINTGGVDVTQQTGGVGINLVTKSGTDKFRGSSRFFATNENVQANNINDDLRRQGATSGNPIQDIKDYGFEMGGPISRGRAWVWGGFGKQTVDVGVVGFYKPTAECQAFKSAAVALASPIEAVNECLNTDRTLLQQTNLKAEVQLFKGSRLSVFNNFNKKERNARGADDLHPIETTTPQKAVDKSFGKYMWNTGPNPTYKVGNQWVVSDRLLLDVQYAHIGNNFTLGLQSPDLRTTQPTFVVSTGMNGRSAAESVFIRPVNSVTFNSTYFLPAVFGADHSFKFGGYWRDSNTTSINHTGGYATVRFPTATENDCTTQAAGCQVDLTRDGNSVYDLLNNSVYVQDTITRGRVTAQLGLRFDYNRDKAMTSSIVANPLGGPWLPGIDFTGRRPRGRVQGLVPAHRPHLQPDRRRPHARPGELRAVLRAGRQRRRCEHDQPGRLHHAAVSVDRREPQPGCRRRRDHAQRDAAVGQHQLVGGQSGQYRVGELGRSEPEERHHRRVHRRPRSRGRQGLRGRRELHLPEVRQLPVERSRQLHGLRLGAGVVHADHRVPGRRRPPHRGVALPDRHLLRADDSAADDHHAGERARLRARVQRDRADRPQADVGPLDDEHQLHLQHDRRALQRLRRRGEPVERHRWNHPDLRGSDQPHRARRRAVRLPDVGQRHRQRVCQRQVAVQAEWPVRAALPGQRVRVLQRAAGLSLRTGHPEPEPAPRCRHGLRGPRSRSVGCGSRTTTTSTSTSSVRSACRP